MKQNKLIQRNNIFLRCWHYWRLITICLDTSSYEYAHPRERERPNPNIYTIDFSRANRYQAPPPRRSREPPPVIEQPPPSYNNSISRSRLQPIPLYSSVRTTPSSNQIRRSSPVITPSVYSAMPPSYAEIFLTSSPLPNGWSISFWIRFLINHHHHHLL